MRHSTFDKAMRGALSAAMLSVLALAGCRQDMHDQPKFVPQRGSAFYVDGRSARPQVLNTVARNQSSDAYFATGMVGNHEGDGLPIPLTMETIQRGQERFNIYCTACHSRVGNGVGMIVQRGYRPAGNFHTDRLRNAPLGHFFAVMTNGYGAMPDYAAQLTPEDRWAVAAYIRALQLSQNAKAGDLNGGHPQDLHEIAKQHGMPDDFANAWGLPSTAIYGTPNNQDNGIPTQAQAATMSTARSGRASTNSGIANGNPAPALAPAGTQQQGHMSAPQPATK